MGGWGSDKGGTSTCTSIELIESVDRVEGTDRIDGKDGNGGGQVSSPVPVVVPPS